MTIEKRTQTSWRAKQMVNGKMYSATFDHKPTNKEAEAALREKIIFSGERVNGSMTFKEASIAYVTMKENILSPNTVRDYLLMPGRCSPWFIEMKIDDIDQIAINRQVNEWAARVSAKTVHNYHGFITTVMNTFRPHFRIATTLPQVRTPEPYIPDDEEVTIIMDAISPQFKIPFILSVFGLRRGEICALQPSDIVGNKLILNKAIAIDKNRKIVTKVTKTTASDRKIDIPPGLAKFIQDTGYVYKGHPNSITKHITRIQKKLGIEHFPLHKMRHYFASKMLTITDVKTIIKMGGWKTDHVMKTIYAHSLKSEYERANEEAAKQLSEAVFLDKFLG